jgi:hypothetical protein
MDEKTWVTYVMLKGILVITELLFRSRKDDFSQASHNQKEINKLKK